jgi:hypothetical protein
VRLLLDTHLLFGAVASSERLPREARELLEDDNNEVYYSAASIWEIAIKSSLPTQRFSDRSRPVAGHVACDGPSRAADNRSPRSRCHQASTHSSRSVSTVC